MAKRANYDDLIGFKTPTQQRNSALTAMIQADMRRIDVAVATGKEDELKALHVELDGTYQNLIENWGSSTYHYIPGHGYTYEYIDLSTLRDNLIAFRGKLRGYLLSIGPEAKELFLDDSPPNDVNAPQEIAPKDLGNPTQRINMYDMIKRRKFDVVKEYERIWTLFNSADHIGPRAVSLSQQLDGCLQFFPISFRSRALSMEDFNETYGFKFNAPNQEVTTDELISYCEYVITLCDHLWEYADSLLERDSEYLRDDLYQTVESCMDELGFMPAKKSNITIYVEKNPAVSAVVEMVDEATAYDVKAYIHKGSQGDLQKKKTILKFLADDIEPHRAALNNANKTFTNNLFQMLQKFVRHNNEENTFISSLSPAELETYYDDIYQMWLQAKLLLEYNATRKGRVEEALSRIKEQP